MKQVLQHLRTGEMELADLPCPQVGHGQLLIQTRASLISAGTERMLVEFSQANLVRKAGQQPGGRVASDGVALGNRLTVTFDVTYNMQWRLF